MSRNRIQTHTKIAAEMALHEWVSSGTQSLERLTALAESWAAKGVFQSGALSAAMVKSEALRLLKERLPDVAVTLRDGVP